MAGDAGSELSRGGMVTKLAAAKIAVPAGTHMVIASGKELHPLAGSGRRRALHLVPRRRPTRVTARKRWIAGTLEPKGMIVIDDGARAALQSGSSLLPAGVKSVSGQFERGEAVIIRDEAGGEIGRGLIGYSAEETARSRAAIPWKSRHAWLCWPRRADPSRRHGAAARSRLKAHINGTGNEHERPHEAQRETFRALARTPKPPPACLPWPRAEQKDRALRAAAEALRAQKDLILETNAIDRRAAEAAGRPALVHRPADAHRSARGSHGARA